MKIKYGVIAVLLVTALESKPHILKIDKLVEIALKHSPDIDSSRLDFEGAQQRVRSAEGFYLPRLDLHVDAGKQWNKLKDQPQGNVDVLTGTLGASQLLYDFGKTAGRVTGSKEEALAYEAQMQQVISDKIFFVKQSYYDVLKTKSIIGVQYKNVKLQKKQLHRAQKYLQSGIKTIIDVSDAQVRLEQAQLDLKNARYELELGRATLEQTIGYTPYNGNYTLYSEKLKMPHLSKQLPVLRTSLEQLESFAYTHRYALLSSEYIVRGSRSNVKTSEGEYYPTLSLHGNYGLNHVDNDVLFITPEKQGQIAVNMSWNLFSGYQTDASVQESKIGVLKASSEFQNVKLAIKKQVLESHIIVRRSKDNVKLSENIAKASLKKFEQAQKRYENELSDYVELQEAQQGYIKSLSDLVNAYYDYFIAMAQLDHAVGR